MKEMKEMKSYAFWVLEQSEVAIEVEVDCDWQRLLLENGHLVVKINGQHGATALKGGGKHELALQPGIYGLATEGTVGHAIKNGKVEVRIKGGKDPWPLPPPPPVPQGFEGVTKDVCRDDYERVFLVAGDDEAKTSGAKTSEGRT